MVTARGACLSRSCEQLLIIRTEHPMNHFRFSTAFLIARLTATAWSVAVMIVAGAGLPVFFRWKKWL